MACELYFTEFPGITAAQKIFLMIQRLTGRAQDWVTAVWREGGVVLIDYSAFLRKIKAVFDHPDQGHSSGQHLMSLQQGQESIAEYSVSWQRAVARTRLP